MKRKVYTQFSAAELSAFEPEMKIGLLGTVDEGDLPHLTLISSLKACSPTQVIWGQFTQGMSKENVLRNPKAGFLIMTLDRNLWRGKANFTHTATIGTEFEALNSTPMFRYNAYFGIHTVYYMDLVEHYGKEALPMGAIVISALKTSLAKTLSRRPAPKNVLNGWTRQLLDKIDNLKFLSYINNQGYPEIIPLVQVQSAGNDRLMYSISAYHDELVAVPVGSTVAIFAMTLDMEDVLLRGIFQGNRRVGGLNCGVVEVNWVYNSMPPKPEQIYPEVELKAVVWE
jgi:hypothetical protein